MIRKLLVLNAVLMSGVLIALLAVLIRQATVPAVQMSAGNPLYVVRGDEVSLWAPGSEGHMEREYVGSLSHPDQRTH